jgi:protease-4
MFKRLMRGLAPPRLAIVPFSGPVLKRGIDSYMRLFKALEENPGIRGVMLEVESPGGSATSAECLYHRLRRLGRKKPLYCYALLAASGGYMAAAAAKKIYAPSTALVGSIGVLSVKPVLRGLMERAGVGLEVMKKGAMKDMTLFHRPSTEEEKKSLDAIHEEIYQRFIELVCEARGLDATRVREIATGELFSASRALEFSLIDGVMDMDSAMDELYRETGVKPGRAIILKPRKPLLRRMMSEAVGAFADELYWRV